jgi:hypothetical protein
MDRLEKNSGNMYVFCGCHITCSSKRNCPNKAKVVLMVASLGN